ncbi:MAG: DNA-3-methyladenine glycosylase [Armatimonadetes bacterium]|nr:DNA-3-methyladenine glycosylase [Akkermansiaceae bacterium]
MQWLDAEFFKTDPVTCAKGLIGCHFRWNGCEGRIVETEAYHALGDEACHTWHRATARKYIETHQAGDAYVYLNYGVHWLFNILVKGGDGHGFVLIRALEPGQGIDVMRTRRGNQKDRLIAAGPGRLTQALGIDGGAHGMNFMTMEGCGIRLGDALDEIVAGPRIGISKDMDLPWRFGDPNSKCLSKKF